MDRMIEISVLGPFTAQWHGGEAIQLNSRKAQALLAYLAMGKKNASREEVANLLWGDLIDERARHNLRQTLSRIRSVLGPVVITSGDSLTLDQNICWVDVIEFQEKASSLDATNASEALGLYKGDLLEGSLPGEVELQGWILEEQLALQKIRCDLLDRYGDALIRSGQTEAALEIIVQRLKLDSAYEPAHRKMMELLWKSGKRSDALRQYQTCKKALEKELGVEPGYETTELYHRISKQKESGRGQQDSATSPLTAVADLPVIAVLPFSNLSKEEDEYFVDGLTEDIITALSRFHSLQVIARGSVFVFKEKIASDPEIAESLGARYLVRGAVQKMGNHIRMNVQLLDGPKGLNIWGNRFEYETTELFKVQDEITSTLVSTLAGRVEATQLARVKDVSVDRLDAYDYLLRGKHHHHRFTAEDCELCIEMFDQAISRDPDFAEAHAWLACGLGQAIVWELNDEALLVNRSQKAAEKGLELDENDSECHRVLAQIHLTRGNIERSLWHQKRALFLNPNDDRCVCAMGEILTFAGQAEEGEEWVRQSLQLNPYHPQRYWTHLARSLLHQSRFSETMEVLVQIGRPRQDDLAYAVVASVLGENGDEAKRSAETLKISFPEFSVNKFVSSQPYKREQDQSMIRVALEKGLG